MAKEGNYRQKLKCPKCGKRKVYIEEERDGFKYICKACGKEWSV